MNVKITRVVCYDYMIFEHEIVSLLCQGSNSLKDEVTDDFLCNINLVLAYQIFETQIFVISFGKKIVHFDNRLIDICKCRDISKCR